MADGISQLIFIQRQKQLTQFKSVI